MVGRRSPSYMRKEVEEEEEQYHSTSHPWVLERHPSMVCRMQSHRSHSTCSGLLSPVTTSWPSRSCSIVSADQIENSINLFFSVKEDFSQPADVSSIQAGLEFDEVQQTVSVALYKCRLKDIPASEFCQLYLKTVFRQGNNEKSRTCHAGRGRAVLDLSREHTFAATDQRDPRQMVLMQIKRSRGFATKNDVLAEVAIGPLSRQETGRS